MARSVELSKSSETNTHLSKALANLGTLKALIKAVDIDDGAQLAELVERYHQQVANLFSVLVEANVDQVVLENLVSQVDRVVEVVQGMTRDSAESTQVIS